LHSTEDDTLAHEKLLCLRTL